MTPLALDCYRHLRLLVPARDPRIQYTDLINHLTPPFNELNMEYPQDRNTLSEALGEIVHACYEHDLPPLPAIVVRRENGVLQYPGDGYYTAAHQDVEAEDEMLVVWGRDYEAVCQTQYPEQL